jgi:hypothetical protein
MTTEEKLAQFPGLASPPPPAKPAEPPPHKKDDPLEAQKGAAGSRHAFAKRMVCYDH